MSSSQSVLPGQVLGESNKLGSGPGTFRDGSSVFASLLGQASTHKNTATPKSSKIIAIAPSSASTILPQANHTVYARVTRIERQQARCQILVVSNSVCAQPLRAILRSQDVRATEKDKVKMTECFHVGDIVRAVVIGLGDQTGYYLSTAGNENGVVMAWSEAGNGCVPISWREVRDEVTGVKELRKVAKPV